MCITKYYHIIYIYIYIHQLLTYYQTIIPFRQVPNSNLWSFGFKGSRNLAPLNLAGSHLSEASGEWLDSIIR